MMGSVSKLQSFVKESGGGFFLAEVHFPENHETLEEQPLPTMGWGFPSGGEIQGSDRWQSSDLRRNQAWEGVLQKNSQDPNSKGDIHQNEEEVLSNNQD
jgi:hypothetical protein